MMNLRHLKLDAHKKVPVTMVTQLIDACADLKIYSDKEHGHILKWSLAL